ncbi:MAG: T9SS type A sorting domain-containing protein, partial [Candidatus Neomarinimicrobiota bacterium]|nr:T9SS type A sorting domain-containing protein [Candidatus Neomarinimicrobiota bacterium]
IAPGVPQGLMAVLVDEGIHLTWEMSADEDFQYYMLEKSSDEAFTEPEVFEMIDIAYLDLDYVLNESNYYRIAAVDHAGNISDYSDVVDFTVLATDLDLIPDVFALHQNYPNPFNPTTQIKYDLPEDAMVSITIYDVMGRSIRSLVNTTQSAGYRSIQWDATNNLGEPVSAGMYIYMIQAGNFTQTKKMVLLK